MNQLRYAVIGTGAIGGYYGSKLAYSGKDVHFLLHSDYDYVMEHGLQVDSCNGSFHVDHPQIYRSTEDMPLADVVIVALKSTNNYLLEKLLPPILKQETLVLMIENGIGIEDDIQKMFPHTALAAGLAFICSAKTEPGRINHQCYGSLNIGNYSCTNKELLSQVISDFISSAVDAQAVEYKEARWKKAVWNMPFNGMTVALNAQTDELLNVSHSAKLIKEEMMEVVNAAQALGVSALDDSFVEQMINLTKNMTPYSPSMKLDYDYGRPMEIEYLYSRPIEIAHSAGVSMPKLEMLEKELRFLASKKAQFKNIS